MGNSLVTRDHVYRTLHGIAEGNSLADMAKSLNIKVKTLYDAIKRDPVTAAEYERVRELQADVEADEIKHIADTEEDPQTARNRIDVRKWRASKFQPRRYGDKLDLTVTQTVDLSSALAEARSRVRPVCDQAQVIDVEVIESKSASKPRSGDSESAAQPAEPDIFR